MATEHETRSFTALLERISKDMDAAYVRVPLDVERVYGTKGQVKVQVTFDGHPYRGSLANMGQGCHVIGVTKDIRGAIGKTIGDKVSVTIRRDLAERIVEVPPMLLKLLNINPAAKAFFEGLSYTNRKEYAVWISSAKKPETTERRLSETIKKLIAGKKNPTS
jgi:hypothetical protein